MLCLCWAQHETWARNYNLSVCSLTSNAQSKRCLWNDAVLLFVITEVRHSLNQSTDIVFLFLFDFFCIGNVICTKRGSQETFEAFWYHNSVSVYTLSSYFPRSVQYTVFICKILSTFINNQLPMNKQATLSFSLVFGICTSP